MDAVFILSGSRTPIASLNESFSTLSASDLGAISIKSCLEKANVDPNQVAMCIMGQVLTAGEGQNPCRQAAVKAGIPYNVPSTTVNMVCGSGLKAVVMGCHNILLDDAECVVVGGQESMSNAPHIMKMRNSKVKFGNLEMADTLLTDGLTDVYNKYLMGVTAENVAKLYSISREDQDVFAEESQRRCHGATSSGFFDSEIVPVTVKLRSEEKLISKDEHPRPQTNVKKLATLKTPFAENGSVTAGNSSGLNDGAASLVLVSKSFLNQHKLKPMAKIVSWAEVGLDPSIMGMGPVEAIRKAVKKCNWSLNEIDLFEINEAFAATALATISQLSIDKEKVNVNGGAIALGHPIGCSGARILVTLLHNLQRLGKSRGVASLCVGGGQGIAVCIELLN